MAGNKAKKSIGKKTVALIILAVLLVLTLVIGMLGIFGIHGNGARFYYLPWLPVSGNGMPEAMTLDRAMGGQAEYTFRYDLEGVDLNDVAKTMSARMNAMGIYDHSATVEGDLITLSFPMDADLRNVIYAFNNQGDGPAITDTAGHALTWEHVASASVVSGWEGSSYGSNKTMTIVLNEEGRKAMQEAGITEKSNLTFSWAGQNLLNLYNSSYGSYTPFTMTANSISFPYNAAYDYMFLPMAAVIQSGDLLAQLTFADASEEAEAEPAAEEAVIETAKEEATAVADDADETVEEAVEEAAAPAAKSSLAPVLVLWIVFLAVAAFLIAAFKLKGVTGVWSLLLYVLFIFFMIADVLYASGYFGYAGLIVIVLFFAFMALCHKQFYDAIAADAGRGDRAAIGSGYRTSRKLFYIENAAVGLIGFILSFIGPVAMIGYILLLSVLANIVLTRVYTLALLYLFNDAFGKRA